MFIWLICLAGSGIYVNPTYQIGILEPIQDEAGNYSTNPDPDAQTEPRDLTNNLNPTD